jgi:hypothetical protein
MDALKKSFEQDAAVLQQATQFGSEGNLQRISGQSDGD